MESDRTQVRDQFYRRVWTQTVVPTALSSEPNSWIVFLDQLGLGKQITTQLSGAGHKVVEVAPGKKFTKLGRYEYLLRPNARSDYDALLSDLVRGGNPPQKIVHLWSVFPENEEKTTGAILNASFYSLLHLAQALCDKQILGVDIAIISNHLQSVAGERVIFPARATSMGLTKGIPKEIPGITCRSIDCDPTGQGIACVAVQIIAELCAPCDHSVIAYRGNGRWIESFESLETSEITGSSRCLTQNGVYIISGLFGDLELAVFEHLLSDFQARIALVGCTHLLPSGQWERIQSGTRMPDLIRKSVERLLPSQSTEGQILVVDAELTRPEDVKHAIDLVLQQFGRIDGVIHVVDGINANLPSTNSRTAMEPSLTSAIERTLALEEISRETRPDFALFYFSNSSHFDSRKAIHDAAVSEFLSALPASHSGQPIISLTWAPLCQRDGAGTGTTMGLDHIDQAKELVRLLTVNSTPGLAVSYGKLPGESQPLSTSPELVRTYTKHENDIQATLTEWWQELLESVHINLDDDFFDLGGDSLVAAQLIGRINQNYGHEFGLSILFEARTIRLLAEFINKTGNANRKEPRPWSPVVPIQPKGKHLPLYVISGLGGNVIKFHSLGFYLGEEQPIFGLLPRGLDTREPYISRLEDLATYYVEAIRAVQLAGPYRLAGYSFGGIVAFEVARQMVDSGESVDLLALLDTVEWNYGKRVLESLPVRERVEIYKEHAGAILSGEDRLGDFRKLLGGKIARLSYHFRAALGRPIPKELTTIEEVNTIAASNYKPKPYQGKLTVFRSTKRPADAVDDEYLGWGELARGGVEVNHIPSTHFDILHEPAVKILAEKLRPYLDRQQSSRTLESKLSTQLT